MKRLYGFLAFSGLAMGLAPAVAASTQEERVDHRTQAALAMDAHPLKGRHQHYDYLNKQMHKLAQGSRHNVDGDLVLFMGSCDERDMRGTADYLSRLRGSGPEHKSMRDNGVVVN